MIYVRNFTLQKYIFPANFTNVKSEFFSKKVTFQVIGFCGARPHVERKILQSADISEILPTFVKI